MGDSYLGQTIFRLTLISIVIEVAMAYLMVEAHCVSEMFVKNLSETHSQIW